jgi:insertion element IS1 protein InsB
MNCHYCSNRCHRKGKQRNGTLKYQCTHCGKHQQSHYVRYAYNLQTNDRITSLLKEGCGTRSIARLLGIAPKTVTKRILLIASKISKPVIVKGRTYEMDELITYIGYKKNKVCIAYAIDRKTREIIDFHIGRRTKNTLRCVVNTLILSESKEIRTDRLNLYQTLIPKSIHLVKQRGINYIERKNLTLRTHLKRLNRKTICFSRSLTVLTAIMKIYCWSNDN